MNCRHAKRCSNAEPGHAPPPFDNKAQRQGHAFGIAVTVSAYQKSHG